MQNRMVLFLMVIGIILAIAIFLLVRFLLMGPSETPPPTIEGQPVEGQPAEGQQPGEGEPAIPPVGEQVLVGDTVVYLTVDPQKAVRIQTEAPPAQPTSAPPAAQPTATLQPTIPAVATQVPVATLPAPVGAGPAVGVDPVIFTPYTVQAGDTLYRITQQRTTSIELMAERGIDATDLVPGTTLNLPVANPNYCINSRPYVVLPGDTVFSIARRYNVSREAIASLNNLGPDYRIDITEVICLP